MIISSCFVLEQLLKSATSWKVSLVIAFPINFYISTILQELSVNKGRIVEYKADLDRTGKISTISTSRLFQPQVTWTIENDEFDVVRLVDGEPVKLVMQDAAVR